MDLSNILRLDRGLILPNNTVAFEKNAYDEVTREIYDVLDRAELENRLDERQENAGLKLGNTWNYKHVCFQRETGDREELMSNNTGGGTGKDKNEKWYIFLDDLYFKLSLYVQQLYRQRYNVVNLDDWGQSNKPQGITVTSKTFGKFLSKIEMFGISEYDTIKNLNTVTDSMIEELNQVLSFTLNHSPTIECSEPDIVVKGNVISLKETIHNLETNSHTNNTCRNFNTQAGKYKLLKIFALSKVFVDTNLRFAGKGISVAIIAPTWELTGLGKIIFNLSGANGKAHSAPKAKTGAHPGNDGSNGSPGNPGVSGETFLGIGATFVGGERLKIISNGGKGGPGQGGGDGAPGVQGKDASRPYKNADDCENEYYRGSKCNLLEEDTYRDPSFRTITKLYQINGEPAEKGGDGGIGGIGGKGGKAGIIQIIDVGGHLNITKHSAEGKVGEFGKGGSAGPGVRNGSDIKAQFIETIQYRCPTCESKTWQIKETKQNGMGSAGKKGKDGENDSGIKDSLPANGISRMPNIINEYKIFMRENLNNPFQQCTLRKFLDLVDINNDVRGLYDVLGLSGEFQDLEEQFLKLKINVDVFPFYSSLLERIEQFAKDYKYTSDSNEVKKVLNYLYTATFGRIASLRENSEQNLIINMRRHLSMIADDINTIKDLQVSNNKVEIINKYKNSYKNNIEEQINEAKILIETQINPEINNISSKINEQVNALIKATIEMQNQAEKDWDKLAEKKKALQSAMALKGLFNLFKIIGGVASFLGPVGTVAGTVITGATTVLEPIALSDTEKILSLPAPVVKDLNTLKGQIEAMRKQKLDYLDKLVKNLSTEIEKNPDTLVDLASKVADVKGKLEKVNKKELDFSNVSVLESELEESIKNTGLKLKNDSNNPKNLDVVKALDKATQIVQFGSLFTEMYSEMEKDNNKMNTITTSMGEMEKQMIMLREYEKSIYKTIAPMMQEMETNMEDISGKLGTTSHVVLDVTKWKVQSTLKGIKLQMQNMTKSHEDIKDELSYSIENLEEVMTTLIKVYDRIQNYQDEQNLANYIADVSSVEASSINIKDQELVNVVNRLEFAIRANIVLEQYKKAIAGLKQWVFPFADKYIDESMLPFHLQLEENIENLVQSAKRKIEEIAKKLNMYDTCIVDGDQSLVCEEFNSRYVSTNPFFVFKNERYKSSISRLLSGREVILKAEVEESAPFKDAIKFSEIEFYWKVKNGTSQRLLNEILKGFDIRATHLGNSYYRNDTKISLITSSSLTLAFSYERKLDGSPVRANQVYRRLKSGDLLLSPYASWKLQLIKQKNEFSFESLKAYENETDLELSGLGSYVDTNQHKYAPSIMKRNKRETFYESTGGGLKECKSSVNRRSVRSVNGMKGDSNFVTNSGSKVMSSPINVICNFLKTYFLSYMVRSIFPIFYPKQRSIISDCSEFSDGFTKTKSMGLTLVLIPTVSKADGSSYKSNIMKERIGKMSNNFNGNSSYFPFLLSDQKNESNNHSINFSDLNCSLLLADLVTRTITGNRYKSSVDEYLLSPREIMLKKICRGGIRNESEIKEMLQRHLSEKEVDRSSSLISKLKSYTKSMLRVFGLVGNSDTEKYIQDIRHLLA